MGGEQQGILAGCGLQGPSGVPAQLLLEPPRPDDPEPELAASQSDGLTNRRMRARMSGGVGGGGATPPPTRSVIFLGKNSASIRRTGGSDANPPSSCSNARPTCAGRVLAPAVEHEPEH